MAEPNESEEITFVGKHQKGSRIIRGERSQHLRVYRETRCAEAGKYKFQKILKARSYKK